MKITKILVALSFLFSVATANAGELTVTGSMEATYNSQGGSTTGNPLGTDRELKFAGSTELDSGITVSVIPIGNLPVPKITSTNCPKAASTFVFVIFTKIRDFSESLNLTDLL